MSRTMVIVVSESQEQFDSIKKQYEGQDVTVQCYTSSQWREGVDNPFFRQQLLNGVPSLVTGTAPINNEYSGNVVAFPTNSALTPISPVQKMEEIEAHAIENAIAQYKGNLTEAAKALGIGRATLYRKVKQYHIDPSAARKRRMAA